MLAELQELTQSERAEVNAVAFGLIFAVAIGFCIVCAYLFNAMVKRSPYDETSGKCHPADDVHSADVWELVVGIRLAVRDRISFSVDACQDQ